MGKAPLLRPTPPLVILTLAAASLLIWIFPRTAETLVYDRQAILRGELWRLWTGHLVHFSPGHLFYNLLVLILAGWFLENESSRRFGLFCVATAGLIGTALLVFEPDMHTYGGLSGLAVGAFVFLVVLRIRRGGVQSPLWWVLLLLIVGKLLVEVLQGEAIFVARSPSEPVALAYLAHVVGALTGGVCGLLCASRPLRGVEMPHK